MAFPHTHPLHHPLLQAAQLPRLASLPNCLPTSPLVSQGLVTQLALLSPFSFSPAYVLLEPLMGSHGSGQAAAMSLSPEPAPALHFLLPAQSPHFLWTQKQAVVHPSARNPWALTACAVREQCPPSVLAKSQHLARKRCSNMATWRGGSQGECLKPTSSPQVSAQD